MEAGKSPILVSSLLSEEGCFLRWYLPQEEEQREGSLIFKVQTFYKDAVTIHKTERSPPEPLSEAPILISRHWELCFCMSFGRVVFELQLFLMCQDGGLSTLWPPTNFKDE